MKKVGIITLFGLWNYGNRLQNYAVEKVVKKMGFKPQTITAIRKRGLIVSIKNEFLNNRGGFCRYYLFLRFVLRYNHIKCIRDIKKDYKFYILGSDQIWHPQYGATPYYFADFGGEDAVKIAYSASFGVPDIEHKDEEKYRRLLSTVDFISVREEQAANIIGRLLNKTAEVLIDPTMMLNDAEWKKISKKPKFIKHSNKYILVYFLGGTYDKICRDIDKIAKEKELEVVYIYRNSTVWNKVGPSEFVWLVNHCKCMITDSFHGCAFSIIMNVPFTVLKREEKGLASMNSRIDTLLNTFELKDRMTNSIDENIFNKKYDKVENILKRERKKAYDFLYDGFNK